MMAHAGAPSGAVQQDDDWLSADDIAALSGGRAVANTVRSWWSKQQLAFEVFPELGTKSNRRSRRADVERFLARKYGDLPKADVGTQSPPPAPAPPPVATVASEPTMAGLIDTLASVRAAAEAAMQALVEEAEARAALSRAHAESDTARAASLKHLQSMLRGYDLALSNFVQPWGLGADGSV